MVYKTLFVSQQSLLHKYDQYDQASSTYTTNLKLADAAGITTTASTSVTVKN